MSFPNETKENENYAKLCRLLYDGGTLALKTVFDAQCAPATLTTTLATHQHKLQKFKGKVLNKDQWNLLYPSSVYSPTSKDFDITLLSFLLNNVCCLPVPIKVEINKIRQCRNKVTAHRPKAEVSDSDFETYWKDISGALVSLGIKQHDIDKLKSSPLGEKDYNQLVEYWNLSDEEVKRYLKEIKTTASAIESGIAEIRTTASAIQSNTEEIKTTTSAMQSDTEEIKTTALAIQSDTEEIKTTASAIQSGTKEIKTTASAIQSGTKEIKTTALAIQSDTEEIKTTASAIQSDTEEIKTTASAIQSGTKEIKTTASAIQSDTAEIKTTASAIQSDTEEIKTTSSAIQSHTEEIKTTASAIQSDTAEIKITASAIQSDTEEIKTTASAIQSDTEEIKTTASAIQSDTEEIKTTTSAIQSDTEEIKTTASAIQSDTEEIKTTTSAVQSDTTDIKSLLHDIKSQVHKTEINDLSHINYTGWIKSKCEMHHPSTRKWILKKVKKNVRKKTQKASALLIRAGPGMGKSTLAAKICNTSFRKRHFFEKGGLLGACHFFQHNDSFRNNPRIMLQSIARQLCDSVPCYQAALETKLKALQGRTFTDLTCQELFGVLLEEPLSQINVDRNVVIVIDALDECASQFKEEIEDVLQSRLSNLPSWMRFIITTRPLPSCCKLNPAIHLEIAPLDQTNQHDLKTFVVYELSKRNAKHLSDKLINISKGIFLVAHFLLDILDENGPESVQEVFDCFPDGISSVYKHYFKRIQSVINPFLDSTQSENSFFNMLEAVVASESPIPKDMFYEILCLKSVDEVPREKRKDRNDAVHLLHTLFPVENDHVTVFHKTVTDWLNLDDNQNPEFSVSVSSGCEVLALKCWSVLKAFKEREKPLNQPLVLSDSEMFLFKFGIGYIIGSSQLNKSWREEMTKQCSISVYTAVAFSRFQVRNTVNWLFDKFDYDSTTRLMDKYAFNYLFLRSYSLCFGHWLGVTGDYLLNDESSPLSLEEKEELRHWLLLNKLPHFSHQIVSSIHTFFRDLYKITNGFIATTGSSLPYDLNILNITEDGCIVQQKNFELTSQVRGVSPDKKYLIITTTNSKVELYDVTTFEKVQEYNCPIDHVGSCHIFGDANQWYIVVQVEGDPNIFILNGLNGQLDSIIKVRDSDELLAVSQCGELLIGTCIQSNFSRTAVDKIHSINFRTPDDKTDYNLHNVCLRYWPFETSIVQSGSCLFSGDGNYLAVFDCIEYAVFVFHTNDGTVYRVYRGFPVLNMCEIVFLSSSCLIVKNYLDHRHKCMFVFYDLVKNKYVCSTIVHLHDYSQLVVVPPQGTDKFIPALYVLNDNGDLMKLEFHCLEQNFLDST